MSLLFHTIGGVSIADLVARQNPQIQLCLVFRQRGDLNGL